MISADGHILVAWMAILLGVLAGAALGLFFDREDWAGGYGSFRRRLMRLGHISFVGLGLLNLAFGLTWKAVDPAPALAELASIGFLVGVVTMPLSCFLAAWKKPLRHLFPVPVLSVLAAIVLLLLGWPT